jgi:hypothetical protein
VDDGERRGTGWRITLPLFQEPDVENIMESSSGRKSHPDGHRVDHLRDLVGPEETGLQLAGRWFQRGDGAVAKTQQNPVAHNIRHLPMSLVIVTFLNGLGLFQTEEDVLQKFFPLGHGLGNGRHTCLPCFIGAYGRRIPAINNVERSVAEGRLICGVVDELSPRNMVTVTIGAIDGDGRR